MRELGIDIIVAQRFNKNFSNISAENFIKIVLCKGLSAQHIVIGDDFRFGHNREGDINYLKSQENKNNFKVHIINEIMRFGFDDRPVHGCVEGLTCEIQETGVELRGPFAG